MSSKLISVTLAVVSLTLFSLPSLSLDLSLDSPEESALTLFNDQDWALLKSRAKVVLDEHDDGDSGSWLNNETSHSGTVKVLTTKYIDEMRCRDTQFINFASEITSTTYVTLCFQDSRWFEYNSRQTTSTSQLSRPPNSSSVLYGSDPLPSPTVHKKVISRTSENCRQLAQRVEELEGKPLRRAAAIERYQTECLN